MWIVEQKGKKIHGIFRSVSSVNKYLEKTLKEEKNEGQSTYLSGVDQYPLFVARYKKGSDYKFIFKGTKEALEKELALKKVVGEILEVKRDYKPKKTGDEMKFSGKRKS